MLTKKTSCLGSTQLLTEMKYHVTKSGFHANLLLPLKSPFPLVSLQLLCCGIFIIVIFR